MSDFPRALIVPGFAKCGTTMLHHAFARSRDFAVPIGAKETQFFLRPRSETSVDGFESLFDAGDVAAGSVLCDITPQYATFGSVGRSRSVYQRIKEVPTLHYGGERGARITCEGREYAVPAHALYVCTGIQDVLLRNVHPHDARRLMSARRSWTHEVSNAALSEYQRRVRPDMESFREILLRHYPDIDCPDYRQAPGGPLSVGDCAPTRSELERLLTPI